jgi:hypothetical protein
MGHELHLSGLFHKLGKLASHFRKFQRHSRYLFDHILGFGIINMIFIFFVTIPILSFTVRNWKLD